MNYAYKDIMIIYAKSNDILDDKICFAFNFNIHFK